MDKAVQFQGLTCAQSPYDAADGQLATVLNLIPEDGALKPLYPGGDALFVVGNPSCTIQYTHVGAAYKHYIIYCSKDDQGTASDSYWWWDGSLRHRFSLPTGFHANGITAIGNVLCFVGDTDTMYAFWNGTTYVIFSRSDLQYQVTVENTSNESYQTELELGLDDVKNFFDMTILKEIKDRFSIEYDEGQSITFDSATNVPKYDGVKTSAVREIFNGLDALANKYLADEAKNYFKYITFGVAAVRMYDGTHINISNVFVLAPSSMPIKVDFRIAPDFFTNLKSMVKSSIYLHGHSVNVSMNSSTLSSLSSIIQGIDIYLTSEQTFIDYNSKPTMNKVGETERNLVYHGNFVYSYSGEKDIYQKFDNMSFYHSVFIPKEEFGTSVELKPVNETNEHLSLANFYREQIGAKYAYTYNNRLHLGNVGSFVPSPLSVYPTYIFTSPYTLFSFELDITRNNVTSPTGINLNAVFVAYADTNNKAEHYYSGMIQYPLPPVVMIPAQASQMVVYINDPDNGYKKKTFQLTRSTSFGMSYYINTAQAVLGSNQLKCTQLKFVQHHDLTNGVWDDNGTWQASSQSEFSAALAKAQQGNQSSQQPNVLKVSEAENPFVFPAANTVAVGVGQIMAIASNTEPITEGQFGEAPLYVFTSEGTWALTLNNEGTYVARQPVSRDVLKSAKSVTPIANAVLFASNRGIMMLAGSRITCITDAISGIPFVFPDVLDAPDSTNTPFLDAMEIDPDTVRYVDFKKLYLQDIRMTYDYVNQRIILFNPAYKYAYVYSLRSQLWGAMKNVYSDSVAAYPESLAIMLDPLIPTRCIAVNINANSNSDVKYLVCTRPLKLDARDVHKTISQLIVRGMFREGHVGTVLYGSNNLYDWFPVNSSVTHELNNRLGTPYKHFRLTCVGSLSYDESISGFDADVMPRLNNKLR